MSFLSLPLREKLLNGKLFGWAAGYRELRTELQRGDRGKGEAMESWAGACNIIPARGPEGPNNKITRIVLVAKFSKKTKATISN